MESVALTDHANLHGAVEFYKACKAEGIKAIIGCDFYVAPTSRLEKKRESGRRVAHNLVLLAKNETGYHNLCKLSSIGYLEGFYYFPRIDKEVLERHKEGLICLSGGSISDLAAADKKEELIDEIKWYSNLFQDDFYLELQRHPMKEEHLVADGMYQEAWLHQKYEDYLGKQTKINEMLVEVGKELSIPCVATNGSHYMERDDWKAHEILLNVQSGEPVEILERDSQGNPTFRTPNPKRKTYPSHELYFKSQEEMAELFKDLPDAISNTMEVAKKCAVDFDFSAKHYPVFVPPHLEGKEFEKGEREKEVENYLRGLCQEGIEKRYTKERLAKVAEVYPGKDPSEVIRERLEYEMSIIAPKGMCDYLLIVWDFIHWAKCNGIPVGPGRGSGAGSIVLYLIGITDIEPLRFHLFFERFINPERLSYPDIDVDICMDRRQDVINYTVEKYGKENVAQIITFGTMKAKMTIKDVGRTLSVPLSKVNTICKLVPDDLNITLEEALEKDVDLYRMYQDDEDAKRIIDIGKKLEGSVRNTGIHAAGIIISGEPLSNLIPICVAKDAAIPVSQFSMKPAEQVGMLKVDFLGLKTLTAIQTATNAIMEKEQKAIDWVNLPLGDGPTFDLLNHGKTLGVFQLESGGMQDLARQLHLDKFEEIIAVGALYRPGPMDMIPSFINRKHGREAIENDHPWMKDILDETYGIMVYQEQVMQIASTLAKYSLGEGDVLRRAMGKKDLDEMMRQREKFRLGAIENGISEAVAMQVFDKMEKFASYGFNKSHAAAYGYLSYVTAFFKANYPKDWMAALMTCDRDDISKVAKFIRESKAMSIAILPPDINEAGKEFLARDEGIRFAMAGIKGVGEGVVEAILEERKKNGSFKSLYEFFQRIDTKKVGKKMVENLIHAGSFDFTGWSRDELALSIEPMCDTAQKEQQDEAVGMMNLFSLMGETNESRFETPPKVIRPSTKLEILLREKELLGFFLTGHPMDAFKDILSRLSCISLSKLPGMDHDTVFRSAFIVEDVKVRVSSKSQRKFAILMISNGMEQIELPIWSDLYEEKGHLLKENQLLYAVLQVDRREGGLRLSCRWFDDLTSSNEEMIRSCDSAYDRAKLHIQRLAKMPRKKMEKPKEIEPQVDLVVLEVTKVRFSEILKLKEILHENPGDIPLKLDFTLEGKSMATLHLDKSVSPACIEKVNLHLKG
jgi:DNA polymerase-3 subunit alpha